METPPHSQTTIFLRPVGSALPLGFFSFGIGMLILGCQALAWIPLAEQKQGGMILMAFVFPLELLATVFAFLARDTLGATTLGLFTTSWLTFGWLQYSSPPGSTSVTIGVYLFGFATAALLLATLSTLGKPYFAVLLFSRRRACSSPGCTRSARLGRRSTRSQAASPSRSRFSRSTAASPSGSRTRTSARSCRSSGAEPRKSRSQGWSGNSTASRPSRASGSSSEERLGGEQ